MLAQERERRAGGVTFVHVFAHNGEVWNEHADLLVQYGKGSIRLPDGDRVQWEGAATSRLHISRAETTYEHAERQHARAARADHQRKHINAAFAAGNILLPTLPAALTLIGIAAAAMGTVTSVAASTARATRTAWSNITNARSKLTAAARRRIEMNKQTAMARRKVVKQSSLTVQERMRICKNRCAAMERKQQRQQRETATNHQSYGTYRITNGSPVAYTTPPPSPPPAVTTALNLNDIISHRDIGSLIMNECGVLSLGRLQITNKAIRSTITSYNLCTKRVFPVRCGGYDHEHATFWANVDRERIAERDDRRDGPQEAIRAFVTATAPTTPRTAIRRLTMAEDSPLGLSDRIKGGGEYTPWVRHDQGWLGQFATPPPTPPESPGNTFTPVYWERPSPFKMSPDTVIESTPLPPRVLVPETPPTSPMTIDAAPFVPDVEWTGNTHGGLDIINYPQAASPTATPGSNEIVRNKRTRTTQSTSPTQPYSVPLFQVSILLNSSISTQHQGKNQAAQGMRMATAMEMERD
jgi:hypothetical protein